MDTIGVVASLVSIIGFLFAVWIWIRSNSRIRELSTLLETIHEITGNIIWEVRTSVSEREDHHNRLWGRMESCLENTYIQTGKYLYKNDKKDNQVNSFLMERGIIWSLKKLLLLETSKAVTEIWLATSDLKPDSSDEYLGEIVNKNLKNGKRYVYFYHAETLLIENEISRLKKNIGIMESPLSAQVTLIPFDWRKYRVFSLDRNEILFFRDSQRHLMPRCFEEINLTQIGERGALWQEHSESTAQQIRHMLEAELIAYKQSVERIHE